MFTYTLRSVSVAPPCEGTTMVLLAVVLSRILEVAVLLKLVQPTPGTLQLATMPVKFTSQEENRWSNKDTVTAIQSYLAAVGVNVVPRLLNPAEIQVVYKDGTFEMGYFANGQGLDPSLGALTSRCGSQLSFTYCNKRVDELYDLALSESAREKRAPYYQEISKIFNEEMLRGWLWYEVRPMAFSNRVSGPAEHYTQMPNLIFDVPVYNEVEKWEVK